LLTGSRRTTAQPKPNIVVIMGDDIGIWQGGTHSGRRMLVASPRQMPSNLGVPG
jgi:arylsulfatase A-like enzyme